MEGAAEAVLSSVVTADMLEGIVAEITGLVPVIVPVAISLLAIRKGIGFLLGILRSA